MSEGSDDEKRATKSESESASDESDETDSDNSDTSSDSSSSHRSDSSEKPKPPKKQKLVVKTAATKTKAPAPAKAPPHKMLIVNLKRALTAYDQTPTRDDAIEAASRFDASPQSIEAATHLIKLLAKIVCETQNFEQIKRQKQALEAFSTLFENVEATIANLGSEAANTRRGVAAALATPPTQNR